MQVLGNFVGIDRRVTVNLGGASDNAQILDCQGVGTIQYYVEQPSYPDDGCNPDSPYDPNY